VVGGSNPLGLIFKGFLKGNPFNLFSVDLNEVPLVQEILISRINPLGLISFFLWVFEHSQKFLIYDISQTSLLRNPLGLISFFLCVFEHSQKFLIYDISQTSLLCDFLGLIDFIVDFKKLLNGNKIHISR
jgi:hypothetical protein